MPHIAESIVSAIAGEVTGLTTTGANVARGRVTWTGLTAALSVDIGQELALREGSMSLQDQLLDVAIVMHVEGAEGTTDSTLNQIANEVYGAVMLDQTHDVSQVVATRCVGRSAVTRTKASETVVSEQTLTFQVHYRHPYKSTDSASQG